MTDEMRLSRREKETLALLLQGKSNKQIALALDISVRTVEFHLKNIYAKLHVNSRVELILKLVNSTGDAGKGKLGDSTVDGSEKNSQNGGRLAAWMKRAESSRSAAPESGREFAMKKFLRSELTSGALTALFAGCSWAAFLFHFGYFTMDELKTLGAPIIAIQLMIGLTVGMIGKRNGITYQRVSFSALSGASFSPLTILPIMFIVVLPLGKLAEFLGLIDPSTMPGDAAAALAAIIMLAIWLAAGIIIGTVSLFVTIRRPQPSDTLKNAVDSNL